MNDLEHLPAWAGKRPEPQPTEPEIEPKRRRNGRSTVLLIGVWLVLLGAAFVVGYVVAEASRNDRPGPTTTLNQPYDDQ